MKPIKLELKLAAQVGSVGNAVVAERPDGALTVIPATPGVCTGCRTIHTIFINRNGRVLCVPCDSKGTTP